MMKLKKFRIIFSSIFFILILFIFFFTFKFTYILINLLTSLQLIPSFLKVFIAGFIPFIPGFILIIILSVLFGRIYCSLLCPLGIFQDIINYFSFKIRKKHKYINPYKIFRYSFFMIILVFSVFGIFILLNLFEPFSIFSRITTIFFKPLILYAANLAVLFMSKAGVYINLSFRLPKLDLYLFLTTFIIFLIIVLSSVFKGRLFCNTLCPAGTALGLISKFSIFKIILDEKKCVSCNKCEFSCKAGCIDSINKKIDNTRCINCFNCLEQCKFEAINYKKIFLGKKQNIDFSKRKFIKNSLVFSLSSCGIISAVLLRKNIPLKSNKKNLPVTPPGAESIKRLTELCIGCSLCVNHCPTKVLKPAFLDYGISGILQPKMDFTNAFCDYECNICTFVCPVKALKPLPLKQKKTTQLGTAGIANDRCLVYSKGQDCGACAEHCPTGAVFMVPYNDLFGPVTNSDYCIGCGACEYICPVRPDKAIIVKTNSIHKTSKKPEKSIKIIDSNKKTDLNKDFPF